jgi:hypothetical protein
MRRRALLALSGIHIPRSDSRLRLDGTLGGTTDGVDTPSADVAGTLQPRGARS